MTSTQTILAIALLLAGAVFAIIYFVTSQIKSIKDSLAENEQDKVLMEWLKEMRGSVDKSQETMSRELKNQRSSMDEQTKMIWERLDNAAKVIGGVQKQLGGLEDFQKNMNDLSNILKSPKLRGNLGERFLYEILENYLPKTMFKTQYKFRDGSVCDAVIITEKGMIPVDSKFPMENFEGMLKAETEKDREKFKKDFLKDVKKRVDEVAKKYILPEEGTTNQAIMYIPSESVYYEAIVRTSGVEEYAQRKNVLVTSPNTFTSFVNIVMVGHKQSELAEHATEILKSLAGIQIETEKFEEDLGILDGHITRTTKSMDNVKSKFGRLIGKISAVQALGSGSKEEPELIE